ncbi:hypothetical protein AHF37_10769 [Paragonimus kellicotti]|nr:hypothetical protein AHF37_10769 [Paragonimus kellicotti]
MADLDIYPVPLSSLQLRDIVLQVAHGPGSTTSGDLTVSSARLLNQLPPEHDNVQRIPVIPSVLLSVGSSVELTTMGAPGVIRRANSCSNFAKRYRWRWLRTASSSVIFSQLQNYAVSRCIAGSGDHCTPGFRCISETTDNVAARVQFVLLDREQSADLPEQFSKLSEGDHCTPGFRCISETTDNVAARVQFVLLDREQSADLPEQFSKIRQFVSLDCGQLTCRLIPQCWVLLLDFVKFIKFTSAPATSMDSTPVQSTHADAVACEDSSLMFSMCVDIFQLTLANCSSRTSGGESMASCDLAELHACSLKLRVLNCLDQITNHLMRDRQFTPNNFKGPYYSVLCEVTDLMINAKPTREAMLYEQRLCSRFPGSYNAPCMSFQFIGSRLRGREFPDEYDAYLWLRLEPTIYTHTQSFLTDVIDSLNAFLQDQDLISRARQSTEGLKVSHWLIVYDFVCVSISSSL